MNYTRPTMQDRERERKEISEFMLARSGETYFIHGQSGVGKSRLIQEAGSDVALDDQVLEFSFKPDDPNFGDSLVSFLDTQYRHLRKGMRHLRGNWSVANVQFRFFGILGMSFAHDVRFVDDVYLHTFFKAMRDNGKVVLKISNVELCSSVEDRKALNELAKNNCAQVAVIIEAGTLVDTTPPFLNELAQRCAQHMEVLPLSAAISEKMYLDVHNAQPPQDFFSHTHGIPLFIEHYAQQNLFDDRFDWLHKKFTNLGPEDAYVLRAVHILGEFCTIDSLSMCLPKSIVDQLGFFITSLSTAKWINDSETGVRFQHPAVAMYLTGTSNYTTDHEIRSRYLESLSDSILERKEKWAEFCFHASAVSNWAKYRVCAPNLAEDYFTSGRYAEAAYIFTTLFENVSDYSDTERQSLLFFTIQCFVLANENQSAERLFEIWRENFNTNAVPYALLEAQHLYNIDDFDASLTLCRKAVAETNDAEWGIAMAITLANLFAKDETDAIRDTYMLCTRAPDNLVSEKFRGDFLRYAPEVLPLSEAVNELRAYLKAQPPDVSGLTIAKLSHNLGVAEFYTSIGNSGQEHIQQAREYFDQNDSNATTYSLVAEAAFCMKQNEYELALTMLLDALNISFERYDEVTILTNIGAVYLLLDQTARAEHFLLRALDVCEKQANPLEDPFFRYQVRFNLAIAYLKQNNWQKAAGTIQNAKLPDKIFWPEVRKQKDKQLREWIAQSYSDFPLRQNSTDTESWLVEEFFVSVPILSFYDFTVPIFESLTATQTFFTENSGDHRPQEQGL